MRSRVDRWGLGLVVLAVVPYIALKLAWLSGSDIGVRDADTVSELHSTRVVVGNNVTIVLELAAVALAVTLATGRGRRAPGWLVLGLLAGATGLLAPILVGLPLGSALQLVVAGDVHTDGMDHLSPWVFTTVYGGFGLLAVGIALLAWRYVVDRWHRVLDAAPARPSGWLLVVGAIGLLPIGTALLWWGATGPGDQGPQAMDTVVQRSVLVVTGLLAVAGYVAPLLTVPGLHARAAWVLTWVGCTTAALQGPALALLANGGRPTPGILLLTGPALLGGSAYGLLLLRATRKQKTPDRRSPGQGPSSAPPVGLEPLFCTVGPTWTSEAISGL